ncbi:MAG: DUF2142 domain-containing protein [Chloroflexi bacterium]|jgi:hypothetical protein|nr:DUF2142 domain-containing protein [Chloroflexota bacterium]
MLRLHFIFSILAVCFAISTPIFEKPDEETHFAYVKHVTLTGQLPTLNNSAQHDWKQEGGQPPLYYWLASGLARWFDLTNFEHQLEPNANPINDPNAPNNKNKLIITPEKRFPNYTGATLAAFILRLLGILPAWVTIYSSYRIAKSITNPPNAPSNDSSTLPILTASLVAFNPMFLFISTSVSNDGLVIALSSMGLWLICHWLTQPSTQKTVQLVLLGGVIGFASITKLSGVMLLPIGLIAIATKFVLQQPRFRPNNSSLTKMCLNALALILPWSTIAGWWYLRNIALYGDFTSTSAFASVAGVRNLSLAEALSEWQGFRWSYIALFGQVNIPAPDFSYPLFDLWLIACAVGLIIEMYRWRSHKNTVLTQPQLVLALFALHITIVLVGILRWTMMTPASQGRLLFPSIASLSLLFAIGWWRFCKNIPWLKTALFLPSAAQCALCWWMALIVMPFTYTPKLLPPTNAPTQPCILRFAPLVDVACPTFARVTPDRLQINTHMRASASTGTNYLLTTRLMNDDQEIAKITTYTGGGLIPSTQWHIADRWLETIEFRVPPTLTVPLKVAFSLNDQERSGLPIFYDVAHPALKQPTLGKLEIGELAAAQVSPLQRGQPLRVTLTWRATTQPQKDYNVFLHLVDKNNKIVAQRDGPPANGFLPTTHWQAPLTFDEQRDLTIPTDLNFGSYQLHIGMYDLQTGARIGIQNTLGEWQPEAALVIANLQLTY